MRKKLAAKRLTASDLTLFEWHFKNKNAGNQKAINLNANVFVDELFPILPEIADKQDGRIPLDLQIYGPGRGELHNLQRKIIKIGSYKNWRLNGEFIHNPIDEPERYNLLEAGDIAIFDFDGIEVPTSVKTLFLARGLEEDKNLFHAFNTHLGARKMCSFTVSDFNNLIEVAKIQGEHPIYSFAVNDELEEIALTGNVDFERLLSSPSLRRVSKENLAKAKKNAEHNGELGEEIVNDYLNKQERQGLVRNVIWSSKINPVSPHDFVVEEITDFNKVYLDVKSTDGPFNRNIMISLNELKQMVFIEDRYDIYRVYRLNEQKPKLKIARNMKAKAQEILETLNKLPEGIKANGISLNPDVLDFGEEILLEQDIED